MKDPNLFFTNKANGFPAIFSVYIAISFLYTMLTNRLCNIVAKNRTKAKVEMSEKNTCTILVKMYVIIMTGKERCKLKALGTDQEGDRTSPKRISYASLNQT